MHLIVVEEEHVFFLEKMHFLEGRFWEIYFSLHLLQDAIPCLGWSSTSRDIKLVLQTVASYHGIQVPENVSRELIKQEFKMNELQRVIDYQKYPCDKMYIFHKFADPSFSPLAFEELHSLELTYGCGLETFVYEITLPIPPTVRFGRIIKSSLYKILMAYLLR